jgi:amino acid transporter
MASGAIGLAQYASYLYPTLSASLAATGPLQHIHRTSLLAIAVVVLVVALLYRRLRAVERMAWVLWAGVIFTLGITIVAGFSHFNARQAFSFPAGAFQLNHRFFIGLGAAMLIATYDYWGYYTISYMAGEVRNPGRTLPRTILGSIVIIAVIYLLMNISVLGVIPWQEFTTSRTSTSHTAVVAELLGRSFGPVWAKIGAWMVIWTAFGSLFSLLLAGSRVLWAAAAEGNYFRPLARLHPRGGFPANVLLLLGAIACLCCFFDLKAIIAALVALRIVLQFLLQQGGVVLLRRRRPEMPRPFRIWLYPLPVIFATVGFLFVLASRAHAGREIAAALVVTVSGVIVYLRRARRDAAWPYAPAVKSAP